MMAPCTTRTAPCARRLVLVSLCLLLAALPAVVAQTAEVEAAAVGVECPTRLRTCTATVAAPRNMFCIRFSREHNTTVALLKQYNPGIDCSVRIPEACDICVAATLPPPEPPAQPATSAGAVTTASSAAEVALSSTATRSSSADADAAVIAPSPAASAATSTTPCALSASCATIAATTSATVSHCQATLAIVPASSAPASATTSALAAATLPSQTAPASEALAAPASYCRAPIPSSAAVPAATTLSAPAARTTATHVRDCASATAAAGSAAAAAAAAAGHLKRPHRPVQPLAQPLAWSTRLQKEAQDWADNCWFEHSQTSYGENLALGHPSIEAAIDGWYSEVDKYDFSNHGFSSGTGQFTQLVWARTYMVGCAIGVCPDGVSYAGGRWQGRLYVCMYWLPGNYPGQFAANVLPALEDASGRRRRRHQRRRVQEGLLQLQLHPQHASDDEL
ncbi:hypothetical protein HYH02_008616 [Chlamydomonas schloesseri]|uniref:SCP domain-containing protein n=1 Tax=Chlamydomonas schloesseri TaxID=2026947 RepID=A0A836B264_9CHLO|nr:hypothetical protein HYH02_008616 [Chlamydomonas schloesseri]|eukprot:KAG2445148.1 hypothetical protein HYH02_008616 [Chlamydomonas schloesseri]